NAIYKRKPKHDLPQIRRMGTLLLHYVNFNLTVGTCFVTMYVTFLLSFSTTASTTKTCTLTHTLCLSTKTTLCVFAASLNDKLCIGILSSSGKSASTGFSSFAPQVTSKIPEATSL